MSEPNWFRDLFIKEALCAKNSRGNQSTNDFFTTKYSGVETEVVVEPSTENKTISLSGIGYTENRKRYIHTDAVIEVYGNDVLLYTADASIMTSKSHIFSVNGYGAFNFSQYKSDRTNNLYSLDVSIPPVTETTTFKVAYKYPDGEKLKDEYISKTKIPEWTGGSY